MNGITDAEFSLLKDHLLRVSGIDVPPEKRYLFETRLGQFLREEEYAGFSDFYRRLKDDDTGTLTRHLVQAMTTHESSFFRDAHPYELLLTTLLPRLGALKMNAPRAHNRRIRILSAGCSKGQEPYSIAMCVLEWLKTQRTFAASDITVLAVDISERILAEARKATYSEMEMGSRIPDGLRDKYLCKTEKGWQVHNDVVGRVRFTALNLAEPFGHLGKFDIIFCRNVVIYFPPKIKRSIIHRFHDLLTPEGVLVIGASESLYNVSNDFSAVQGAGSTYYVPGGRITTAEGEEGACDRAS